MQIPCVYIPGPAPAVTVANRTKLQYVETLSNEPNPVEISSSEPNPVET
jgi:hypothetical protein